MGTINVDAATTGLGLFRCVARTELKEKFPDVPDGVLLYLNHAITEAYKLGAATLQEEVDRPSVITPPQEI